MRKPVFGPVPSRRLGRSLGVDLIPFKTCSYDCVYCQLGPTTLKTVDRKSWVPLDDVLPAVKEGLAAHPDCITLSGSGEPTLHSGIGEAIERIKSMTALPMVVLTNGSLLWQPEVRRELAAADIVVPSLDAADDCHFATVNRPHEAIEFERMLEGLVDFRHGYTGQIWLEVLLLAGESDDESHVAALADCVGRIRPDRVQLNTVARPPAEPAAKSVSRRRLEVLAPQFCPRAEVICPHADTLSPKETTASREQIASLLERRPCTLRDIATGLDFHPNEVAKYIEQMIADGQIVETIVAGRRFYQTTSLL